MFQTWSLNFTWSRFAEWYPCQQVGPFRWDSELPKCLILENQGKAEFCLIYSSNSSHICCTCALRSQLPTEKLFRWILGLLHSLHAIFFPCMSKRLRNAFVRQKCAIKCRSLPAQGNREKNFLEHHSKWKSKTPLHFTHPSKSIFVANKERNLSESSVHPILAPAVQIYPWNMWIHVMANSW